MCRLTAYRGESLEVSTLVFGGSHSLYRQSWEPKELIFGSVNADGWGVVWYGEHGVVRVSRAEPIWHARDLEGLLSGSSSPIVLAALRNATPGLPISASAAPPLVHDRWAFILNGFVPDFRERHMRTLRGSLPDQLYSEIEGVSDAETLSLLVVHAVQAGATLCEALEEMLRRVFTWWMPATRSVS